MSSKIPKLRQRAKILEELDGDAELQVYVSETKQRLISLGFIPPPVGWNSENSAYIQDLGVEAMTDTEREDDPIQCLQRKVASVVSKYGFTDKVTISKNNSRIRYRITDVQTAEQFLMQKNLILLRCIMRITDPEDYEKVSRAIVVLFEANKKVGYLFEWLIKKEIATHTQNSALNTLFREDSLRIKVLSNYFKMVGKQYLKRLLGPVILEAKKPSKLPSSAVARNLADLLMSQLEEDFITCPDSIRVICELTKEETLAIAPHYLVIAIGNLVFLRWISPALIQPHSYGIVDVPPTTEERKLLIYTAKSLQCAVNSIGDESRAVGDDPWMFKLCSRILSYLVQLPKRADELDQTRAMRQEILLTGVLDLYREVKVLRDFEAQRLYRHIRLHIDDVEWIWSEVSCTPV